jgi:hypothetical protein
VVPRAFPPAELRRLVRLGWDGGYEAPALTVVSIKAEDDRPRRA